MIGSSDEELLARVAATEDSAAFESLVKRHQSKVRNWLRQLTGDPALADDLAQETFIHAWRGVRSFKGSGKFSSWLMKIAYNNFLQSYRRQKRELRLADHLGASQLFVEPGEDAEELVDLPRMLSLLKQEERVAMILCYAHGYSHAEISEITDTPLGTVKSHIRRGRSKIQERFKYGEPQ